MPYSVVLYAAGWLMLLGSLALPALFWPAVFVIAVGTPLACFELLRFFSGR